MKPATIAFFLTLAVPFCWSGEKPGKKDAQTPATNTQVAGRGSTAASSAHNGKHLLTDEEMDQVCAGGVDATMTGNVLSFAGRTANGEVSGAGTVEVRTAAEQNATSGVLILQDSAQSGSKSFIGINAVNSQIQVLLNLNVNINSTVGTLSQTNLSGK
jgi:hypothetical protein